MSLKLNVTLLTTSYPLYPGSSSGIFIDRLIRHMHKHIQFKIVTPSAQQQDIKMLESDHISIFPFRYAPASMEVLAHGPGGIPVAMKQGAHMKILLPIFVMSMMVAAFRYSIKSHLIHANWAICGFVAGIVGALLRKPVIVTLRGEDMQRSHSSYVDYFLLRACVGLCTRVVTVSEAFKDELCARFPQYGHKVVCIENGVQKRFLDLFPERKYKSGANLIQLLFVGSLIERKGLDQLILAIAECNLKKQVIIRVVGDGVERARLQNLVGKKNLQHVFDFMGEMDEGEIPHVMLGADILVLPSHSEGRPNVVLEAMATGLPVVATDIDGVNEIVVHEKTGLLFTDNDIDMLASFLQRLIMDDNIRAEYGKASHDFIVSRQLVWTRTADHYESVYRDSLGVS